MYLFTPDGEMNPNPCTKPCTGSMILVKLPGGRCLLRNYRKARKRLFGIEPGKFPLA